MMIFVDIEADGPIPGDYSMIAIGAVAYVEGRPTFLDYLRPISEKWVPQALKVSGFSREGTLQFPDAKGTMQRFYDWTTEVCGNERPFFVSDNNGFDWMFVAWYFHHFLGRNPFGHSSTNLGSLYKGLVRSMFLNFKHLRKTPHTHHPLDDATGNLEAFEEMVKRWKVRFR
jgi:hypothetical protein